jgi:uncharacterized membrane protein
MIDDTGRVAGMSVGHRPQRRLLRARHRLRANVTQLLFALGGLAMGLTLPRAHFGPTVETSRIPELLFSLGIGVIGVVSIVFSLLFGVVQFSASTFTPRLTLFSADPLVWRTFALAIGVFVFSVTAGLSSSKAEDVSVLVPTTSVLAVLLTFALIRALQTRAFLSLQLAHVLEVVASRGREVIADVYPVRAVGTGAPSSAAPSAALRRTVTWSATPGVVQQLDLQRLVDAAAQADSLVVFRVGVGDAVYEQSPLADIRGGDLPDAIVQGSVVRGTDRSFDQDPMLALRLLADIGLRALSPAVNDPATAVDAIDATEGLLRALATRELDVADVTDTAGATRVRLMLPTWEDYLRTAVEDLLAVSMPFTMVLERLQRLLTTLQAMSAQPQAPLIRLHARVAAGLTATQGHPATESSPDLTTDLRPGLPTHTLHVEDTDRT